jgi:choline/glycine/proline betaine transport protein
MKNQYLNAFLNYFVDRFLYELWRWGIAGEVNEQLSTSLNSLLDRLPIAFVTKWLGLLLVGICFITSSDSGSLVDDMATSGRHPNPPVLQRAFRGIAEGASAAVLLMARGLQALPTAAISSGLTQRLLVLAACIGLVRALRVFWYTDGIPNPGTLPHPRMNSISRG